jgi:hypothetical protein
MALSSANYILERLNLDPKPIGPRDIVGLYLSTPNLDKKPMMPGITFQTTNFGFIFDEGGLICVRNMKTNIEEVEHYKEWAKMPSLIGSNEAYHLATNWLARVSVDISALNKKYEAHVGQPFFWGDQGTNKAYPPGWGIGTNKITLPLYYVTWGDTNNEAAKVGIFGPTKQLMGLTIEDQSLLTRMFIVVTNQKELMAMTNVPQRMIATNPDLYKLFYRPDISQRLKKASASIQTNSTSH